MTPATRHELWDLTRDLRTGKVLKMDRVPNADFDVPAEDRHRLRPPRDDGASIERPLGESVRLHFPRRRGPM